MRPETDALRTIPRNLQVQFPLVKRWKKKIIKQSPRSLLQHQK